jgi:hypothetical protein
MTNTLLNIAGKIDPQTVSTIGPVSRVIAGLAMPYVIVGATARDLVLHYGHGANIQRATHDVDFAIEVPNWTAFEALRDRLCELGFKTTQASTSTFNMKETDYYWQRSWLASIIEKIGCCQHFLWRNHEKCCNRLI